jgi:BolA family transcriptional regulator, general stress-responsive regulator
MNAPASTAARIERILTERLQPTHLEVRDDSAAHVGHAGAGGGGHFRVRIVSLSFSGLKSLQRHRLVNEALAPLFKSEVHAVAMETLAPEEFIK